jgi:diketogulonate reductase-like aldo/keto reductase
VYEANHHEDHVMEMPQSGEPVRGRENMRKFHVRLTQRATAALKEHRKRQLEERIERGDLWQEQGLVFPSAAGQPELRLQGPS